MPTICAKSTLLFGKVTITELGRLLLPQLLLLRVFVATTFCSGMANPRSVGFDEVTVERVVRRSRFSRVAFKAACRLSGFFVVLGGASLLDFNGFSASTTSSSSPSTYSSVAAFCTERAAPQPPPKTVMVVAYPLAYSAVPSSSESTTSCSSLIGSVCVSASRVCSDTDLSRDVALSSSSFTAVISTSLLMKSLSSL